MRIECCCGAALECEFPEDNHPIAEFQEIHKNCPEKYSKTTKGNTLSTGLKFKIERIVKEEIRKTLEQFDKLPPTLVGLSKETITKVERFKRKNKELEEEVEKLRRCEVALTKEVFTLQDVISNNKVCSEPPF